MFRFLVTSKLKKTEQFWENWKRWQVPMVGEITLLQWLSFSLLLSVSIDFSYAREPD